MRPNHANTNKLFLQKVEKHLNDLRGVAAKARQRKGPPFDPEERLSADLKNTQLDKHSKIHDGYASYLDKQATLVDGWPTAGLFCLKNRFLDYNKRIWRNDGKYHISEWFCDSQGWEAFCREFTPDNAATAKAQGKAMFVAIAPPTWEQQKVEEFLAIEIAFSVFNNEQLANRSDGHHEHLASRTRFADVSDFSQWLKANLRFDDCKLVNSPDGLDDVLSKRKGMLQFTTAKRGIYMPAMFRDAIASIINQPTPTMLTLQINDRKFNGTSHNTEDELARAVTRFEKREGSKKPRQAAQETLAFLKHLGKVRITSQHTSDGQESSIGEPAIHDAASDA